MLVDTKSDLYFDFLQFIYESFILFYQNKFQFSIETYVKSRGLVLASPPLYTCIVAKYIIYLYELKKQVEKCEKENFPVSRKK